MNTVMHVLTQLVFDVQNIDNVKWCLVFNILHKIAQIKKWNTSLDVSATS